VTNAARRLRPGTSGGILRRQIVVRLAFMERRLADASSGWNAVAVGTSGRPGLALKARSEQEAVNDALGNCDSDCHVIAIGPFAVGPN
jgi:hypothetical protein